MRDQPVRLAIVSRQEVVARGLTAMLADYPDRVIVTALPTVWTSAAGVEVVLYDTFGLHGNDGGELEHLVHNTQAKVLIFSRDMRPDLRARAEAHGCRSWVSMSTRAKELVEAIELTAADRSLPGQEDGSGHDVGLSPREAEVLALVAHGHSNIEIAEKLHLSANTLKSHIRQAYRKIGATSRSQAVAWALQNGFSPLE